MKKRRKIGIIIISPRAPNSCYGEYTPHTNVSRIHELRVTVAREQINITSWNPERNKEEREG